MINKGIHEIPIMTNTTGSMKTLLEAMEVSAEVQETVLHEDERVADELYDIKEQIKELVGEAIELIPHGSQTEARAKSYWYPQILQALDSENSYMGGSMHSMQDSIDEIVADGRDDGHDEEDF